MKGREPARTEGREISGGLGLHKDGTDAHDAASTLPNPGLLSFPVRTSQTRSRTEPRPPLEAPANLPSSSCWLLLWSTRRHSYLKLCFSFPSGSSDAGLSEAAPGVICVTPVRRFGTLLAPGSFHPEASIVQVLSEDLKSRDCIPASCWGVFAAQTLFWL